MSVKYFIMCKNLWKLDLRWVSQSIFQESRRKSLKKHVLAELHVGYGKKVKMTVIWTQMHGESLLRVEKNTKLPELFWIHLAHWNFLVIYQWNLVQNSKSRPKKILCIFFDFINAVERLEDKRHLLGTSYITSRSENRECFQVTLLIIRQEGNTQEAAPWPCQSQILPRDKSNYSNKVIALCPTHLLLQIPGFLHLWSLYMFAHIPSDYF